MNKPSLIFITIAVLLSLNPAKAVIYGADDRKDIDQVPQYREIAKAVAVAVGHNLVLPNGDGTYRIDAVESSSKMLCQGERFLNQTSLGVCTGFLVGDRYLLTAGHCGLATGIATDPSNPFCTDLDWYFDYNSVQLAKTSTEKIPANKIYRCKRLIRAENVEAGNDFALLELDRPVIDFKGLELATKPVASSEKVFTIGHPSGLPAKFSGLSPILENKNSIYFAANLDTQGGNSGGPVFNSKNQLVGILVSGFPIDYYTDSKIECERLNRCDDLGNQCLEASPFAGQQKSNYIQRIETILNYFP